MSALALFIGLSGFGRNLELMSLDLRYRMRPRIATLPEIGFIDYDDSSLEVFGEWPWPRFRHIALVNTLDFYKARMAGFDVFFVENENTIFHPDRLKKALASRPGTAAAGNPVNMQDLIDNSFRNYDSEFAYAMEEANNIYLAYFTFPPDEKVAAKGLAGIREDTRERRKRLSGLKKMAMEEVEKTFLPLRGGEEKDLYKVVEVDPPLPDFVRTAKGVGFAQPGVDDDSVERSYILARYYNNRMIYPIAWKMLSDIMDFKLNEVVFYPGKYALIRNALDYKTKQRRDVRIPIDDHYQMLVNWAGDFRNTFVHVPFRLISTYHAYNTAKEIARKYGNGDGAGLPVLKDRISEAIMEQSMVTTKEADAISKEIAAAQYITKLSDKGLSRDQIFRELGGTVDRALLQQVFSIVSAGRDMEKALASDPSLTFEQFSGNQQQAEGGSGAHLREVFRNMKFFSDKKRLEDARPYYFPAAAKVLSNGAWVSFSPVDLENKIFMVGLTGTNTIDLNPTPFEENCPLVAYHVNALNTVLTENFLHYPPGYYKYIATVFLAALVGIAGVSLSLSVSLPLIALAAGGYLFSTCKIWETRGYWLDWVAPAGGMALTYVTVVAVQFIGAFREKKKVRGIFSTMVSPAVLKVMEENPDKFSLTGERKAATTFFSMVNGMGGVTKTIAPDELASLLSIYLTPNSEIIMDYDGYIDKYEGHVIMADFGAPLDDEGNPWKCAFAALEQQMDVEAFKYFVRAKYGLEVGVSMGFNYGYVSAGNMGSERKFQYTVMGDPVNVAARFMASNYIYNSFSPITGEETLPAIADYVHLRPLDKLLLKGKTKPTAIYNVLGWKPDAYLKLRGRRPVPEFLGSLWAKCPPEKIFGYHRQWERKYEQTGHPTAAALQKFFGNSLDPAKDLLVLGWKREIAAHNGSIEAVKAEVRKSLGRHIDFLPLKKGSGFREVMENWEENLTAAIGAVKENGLQKGSDRAVALSLEQSAHSGQILLNKIAVIKMRLEQGTVQGGVDERIEEAMQEIRDFLPGAHEAVVSRLDQALLESRRRYNGAAGEFFKSIKEKKEEYHEMMSLAGAPAPDELKAARSFEEGLNLYRERAWEAALEKFEAARRLSSDKGPAESFCLRINGYKTTPPGENWQGEFVQTKK